MISEKIELLGKGLYKDIPDQLTLKSIPTVTELDMVGSEEFDKTMLNTILPVAVEEKINFGDLLAVDYYWVCRCLRMLNYGPYFTTSAIFCPDCKKPLYGEYRVDLRTVECKVFPEGFNNKIVITEDEFIDYNKKIELSLLTIQEEINAANDQFFTNKDGKVNRTYSRICYMIRKMNGQPVTPIDAKVTIDKEFSPADFVLLKEKIAEVTSYGLASGGRTICPHCGSKEAAYMALVDDRFFRPTVGDIKQWRIDRSQRSEKDGTGSKATSVRKNS